jgi:hypothetical protein
MRVLSYLIAIVLLLTGPSIAGSAEDELPGIGAFSYNGTPILTQTPAVMAAIDVGH